MLGEIIMSRKAKLLSIGDMSKLTRASIRSIRYYEKINLLIPAFIDPDTGYRYYSFEQSSHIEMIRFCIELDIPLKELPTFIGKGDTIDYRAFLAHGKQIAQKKIKALQNGLKLITGIEKQLNLAEAYEVGQVYTREVPEKYVVCKPCNPPLSELDRFELVMSFFDLFDAEHYSSEMAEYGFLREFGPAGDSYYAFMEVPMPLVDKDVRKIPAGVYFCRQDDNSQIENAHMIFKGNLAGTSSFLAIETEILTSKPKISKPLNELRVIQTSVTTAESSAGFTATT